MIETSLAESLEAIRMEVVGVDNVLSDPYDLDRYSADAILTPYRAYRAG